MRPRSVLLASFGVFASLCVAASATTSGTNGRIDFRRWLNADNSRSAIFTMKPDGSDVRQITQPFRGGHDDQADWSPDATRLAFTRFPDNGPAFVLVTGADGSGTHRVTPRCRKKPPPDAIAAGCEDTGSPSFTPDGRHLTFARATGHVRHFKKFDSDQIEHSAIAIVGTDGTGEHELLHLPRYAGDLDFPQVSPDGQFVVFERHNSPLSRPRLGHALFVANADGSNAHRVTPWSLDAGDNPDWAPDSSRILFRSRFDVDDDRSQYFTVKPDGTGLTQLTHFPYVKKRRLFSATFSPDGAQIVFARADTKGRGDIWLMNANGSDPRPIEAAAPWDSAPDWGSAP